ncbi:MAG: hypothetical protein ACSLE2_09640 [Lysobacterales bacterium]
MNEREWSGAGIGRSQEALTTLSDDHARVAPATSGRAAVGVRLSSRPDIPRRRIATGIERVHTGPVAADTGAVVQKRIAAAVLSACLAFAQADAAAVEAGVDTPQQSQSPTFSCGHATVVLVVDPLLVSPIRSSLDRFEADLCAAGYNTIENAAGLADPAELRNYLGQLHGQPEIGLVGAILIGDVPYAYQWVQLVPSNPALPPLEEEVISFQYYADLDGVFSKSAGFVSPGGHAYSFDVHSGEVDWEIWVGVLPFYKGGLASTIEALERYLQKNHDFRTGVLRRPNVFLQISELLDDVESLRTGQYVWTPFSSAASARLYAGEVSAGYADLSAGASTVTVVDAHGNWGASGQLTIADVETNPVRTSLFWSSGCAIGDLDHSDNFLTSVLYSSTSEVLVAKGTTNDSGGLGNNLNGFYGHNIALALSAGASIGDAILSHVNVPLVVPWSNSREFHFATPVVLGDPTLDFPLNQQLAVNAGHSGAWYNENTPGQGFLIDAYPNPNGPNFIFVAWFTFSEGTESAHRWLTAQGEFAGSTAEIAVHETTGGRFDDPQPVNTEQVGTMSIDFTDCSNAQLSYSLFDEGAEGDMTIIRLIPGAQALCEQLAGVD